MTVVLTFQLCTSRAPLAPVPSLHSTMDFLGNLVKALGAEAIKHVRRSHEFDRLVHGKQLLVVQPDHWLFPALCQFKRKLQEGQVNNTQRYGGDKSLDDLKKICLGSLLANIQHKELSFCELNSTGNRAVVVAGIFSTLLPQYEPLLVELAVVHCAREWCHKSSDPKDLTGFERFLMSELVGENAMFWFGCQFFLDSLDLLDLAPYYYKQRITNQALKDVISICVTESRNDSDKYLRLLIEQLAKEKNKAVHDSWLAFIGEEVATVGSPQRSANPKSLAVLGSQLMNPTLFDAGKRGYFPVGVAIRGFGSREFADHVLRSPRTRPEKIGTRLASSITVPKKSNRQGQQLKCTALLRLTSAQLGNLHPRKIDSHDRIRLPFSVLLTLIP